MTTKLSPLIPVSRFFPEEPQILIKELNNMYLEVAYGVNSRDIGVYSTNQEVTGQKFFVSGEFNGKDVARKCFLFDSILNGTTSQAHGIQVNAQTLFTRIYGVGTNPSTSFIPLPYVNVGAPADGVTLNVTSTNVQLITTTANFTAYKAVVILEFIL